MRTIYVEFNGISLLVLNNAPFQLFNWFNFKKGAKVYVDCEYFADFISYEKSEVSQDEIIKLKIK